VTRIQYDAPEDRSTLEIFRNYELALQRAGFETLFAASGADLGDRRFGLISYPQEDFAAGITARHASPFAYFHSIERDQRFLAAKLERPDGDVYPKKAVRPFSPFGQNCHWSMKILGLCRSVLVSEHPQRYPGHST
jgi:hypothetical protein